MKINDFRLMTSRISIRRFFHFQIGSDIGPILEAVVKTLHLLVKHFKKTFMDFDEVSQVQQINKTIKSL